MKIIAIGDIHGRSCWKEIVEKHADADIIIFIGDYFDSFNINGEDQINNFLDIMRFSESNPGKIITLIGNHDINYFEESFNNGTSGFQHDKCYMIKHALMQYKANLQMAYQHEDMLFTHAGVSPIWLAHVLGDDWALDVDQTYADLINDIWKYKPLSFLFNGRNSSGDDMYQTPVWIRPRSLMYAGQVLKKEIIQIVGHTVQNQIDIQGKATGKRYFFIDTLGTSGEYLVIENNIITSQKITINES